MLLCVPRKTRVMDLSVVAARSATTAGSPCAASPCAVPGMPQVHECVLPTTQSPTTPQVASHHSSFPPHTTSLSKPQSPPVCRVLENAQHNLQHVKGLQVVL